MVNILKIFYSTNSPMIMNLGMEQYLLKVYKVNIKFNDDPELTLTQLKMPNFVFIVGPHIR